MLWKTKKKPLFDNKVVGVKKSPDLKEKLDKEFSLFIRFRDSEKFDFRYFRCISCGQIKPFEQADCGHYFSRSNLSTRFDEDNCHSECRSCNCHDSAHLEGYKKNLISKIGKDRFYALGLKIAEEKRCPSDFKIDDSEYKERIAHYKSLNSKLKTWKC